MFTEEGHHNIARERVCSQLFQDKFLSGLENTLSSYYHNINNNICISPDFTLYNLLGVMSRT